jgi:hypothetical protein
MPPVCLSACVWLRKGESMMEHVGYFYAGGSYCLDNCVLTAMGHTLPVDYASTEKELSRLAQRDGVNRDDEASFDAESFPKLVHTPGTAGFVPRRCRGCREWVGGIEPAGEEPATPYWAITAAVTTRTRSRGVVWYGARGLPTFSLHESVHGILSARQAARIARDVIDPLHLLSDDDIAIFAFKV